MRTLIAALCLMAAAAPAGAQDYSRHSRHSAGSAHAIARPDNPGRAMSRYNAATTSCAEIQSRIHTEGAVVVRFSKPNSSMPHYGRYVDSMHYCSADELLSPARIPTSDDESCRVVECVINR